MLSRESLVDNGWTDDARSAQDAVASVPWAIYLLLVVVWVGSLAAQGAYASRFAGAGNEEYRAVFRAAGFLVALLACTSFFLQVPFSRLVVAVAVPLMLVLSTGARWVLRRRHREAAGRRGLAAGDPPRG